jgi:hypothetical protein
VFSFKTLLPLMLQVVFGLDGHGLALHDDALFAHLHLAGAASRGRDRGGGDGDAAGQDGQAAASAQQVDSRWRRQRGMPALSTQHGAPPAVMVIIPAESTVTLVPSKVMLVAAWLSWNISSVVSV